MPIVYAGYVRRQDVQKYRGRLYVFGDNEMRFGLGGQAKEMRGEPNAVGIRTNARPDTKPGSYWSDSDYDRVTPLILEDMRPIMEALKEGREVVIPVSGIGTGLSQLPQRAPKVYAYLQHCLRIAGEFASSNGTMRKLFTITTATRAQG